ncbi:PVC-type heme-binding CxxCH protein [Alienimonas californiensis]|uniref:Cytochrome c-552 n=1 Tax=Alienimonas californiensis TaxID=2527989 RepID=A0A517P8N4_9PLAN|nr:PVC-type heme-binding CxxCH protein [Alienimonas californiensis]QDT15727.1 Cytochrome c-552 precursor [Alienimonas californiensis]
MSFRPRSVLALLIAAACVPAAVADEIEFKQGDHVAYIGNTLADRMQHHAWLETYLHALLPDRELTFRNLGFSGDELKQRQRADNFGDADQWLTKVEADVIFCFFGYNEALEGEGGLASFKKDLEDVIAGMRSQKYNGESAPRLVMFSPIAHENLNSPHLPDGSANNANLALYTEAMRAVCEAKQVPFVDLFSLSQKLYAESEEPLTTNGVHLLDRGDRLLARAILTAPDSPLAHLANGPLPADEEIADLREAALNKNYEWFSRYRVVDEYNVFGGRSKLAWFGQSNGDVMMREMEIFDVKTANRDRVVWAIAQGSNAEPQDDNLPPELVVRPNKEGPLEDGAFPYLGGEEAISQMTVQDGLEVNLFASEKEFPRLVNPVQMSVDPDGRLWASVWTSYPHWNPTEPRRDAIVILPDEDRDGKADDCIVFADGLNSVTGFEFWGGGVLVAALPELWFLKDTDGDNKADVKIRMLQGLSSADSHHSANAMLLGPDGWLYWSRGIFNVAAIETPTQTYRSGKSGVHRFNPRTFEMEFHYPIGPNPHGDVFDQWGYQFANDGTSGTGGYVSIGKGLRPGGREWFKKEWRPVAATGLLASEHFPEDQQGNFLICNTIGFLGVLQYEVQYNGAEITADRTDDLLQSTDPNFRPVDVEIGGDGALYVADWQNTLIGHMQHNMRDPNRDHAHGRIYRVTAKGRDLIPAVTMSDASTAEVLQNFFSGTNNVRYRARLELSGRDAAEVLREIAAFTDSLDPKQGDADRDAAQALLECLWVHEEFRVPNIDLVKKTFQAEEPRVRAAAIRTLGHWAQHLQGGKPMTGHLPGWDALLLAAATDESALVRAEALKAAVEFADYESAAPAEAIFAAATRPTDPELNDVLEYARGEIDVKAMLAEAIRSGKPLSPAAEAYALENASPELLLELDRSPAVYQALLTRARIPDSFRLEAVQATAKAAGRTPLAQLAASLRTAEAEQWASLEDLAALLPELAGDAAADQQILQQILDESQSADVREAAYAAWLPAGDAEAIWGHASRSRDRLGALLTSLGASGDPAVRERFAPRVRPLMFEVPEALRSDADSRTVKPGPAVSFEYFAPNPKNVRNETLDELKPALTGQLDQFEKFVPGGAQDAFATRQTAGLVVPVTGDYTFHLASDDGSRLYVDGKEVVNHDGLHGMNEKRGTVRLDAGVHEIVLNYFDNGGNDGLKIAWEGPGISKRPIDSTVLRSAGSGNLRQQALGVIADWPENPERKVDDFARLIADGALLGPALRSLASLPGRQVAERLPPAEAKAVLDALLKQADAATPVERQSAEFSNLLTLAGQLATANRVPVGQRLADLRASIPVEADPRVMALGAEVYSRESHCATCHQPSGQGLPNLYPPIDGTLWATGDEDRLIRMVLDGMHGAIEVKGKRYSSPPLPPMTGFRQLLTDEEIAAVLTYVRNSWSNRAKPITPAKVAEMRAIDRGEDATFWSAVDLLNEYPLEDGSQPIEQPSLDGWVPRLIREWKANDFTEADLAAGGRSYESGKLAFKRIGCTQCHQIEGDGGEFGPNLAQLDPKKRTAAYVLESMLNPSKEIEPKYAMRTYLTTSGEVASGFVIEETDDEIRLKSDPLARAEPTVVLKSEVVDEMTSDQSAMPNGLLNYFTKEEVLDLVAYVRAGGDSNSEVFKK